MSARLAADLLVIVHGLFIVFVVAGGFLALWRPWLAFAHLPAAAWGAWIEFAGRICPLTPLENEFRRAAGEQGYARGVIEHDRIPIIYPGGLTREIQVALGVAVIVINVVAYGLLMRRLKGRTAS